MIFRKDKAYWGMMMIGLLLGVNNLLFGQDTITLSNPSFEDSPRHSKVPEGWINCGFEYESPPDIGPTDFFRAQTQASHGETHLIMVTRRMGTWERIGNLLSSEMQVNQCYDFSLDLARSDIYLSISRATASAINFNTPIRLRIWGANKKGKLQELLAVSDLIAHEDWQTYSFILCPSMEHNMLVLEAMYKADAEQAYGGNIMLDNCSDLILNETAHRNDEQLKAWAAEPIPTFQRNNERSAVGKSIELVDTLLLAQYMNEIISGRVDIGLTNLANYAQDFTSLPWILVVDEADSKLRKEKIKVLRERIKGMKLNGYLQVRPIHKLPTSFQQLVSGLGWRN